MEANDPGNGNGEVQPSPARLGEVSGSKLNGISVPQAATSRTLSTEVVDGAMEAEENKAMESLYGQVTPMDSPPDGHTATIQLATPAQKRKPLDDESDQSVKRVKLAQAPPTSSSLSLDKSLLPAEIWHHIFTFCPPKSLGKLLVVNKLFNRYLDPASSVNREVRVSHGLMPLTPNTIWRASRRLFWPQMPAPFQSKTELDMWRLLCSARCQDCGKLDVRGQDGSSDPRHPGPGPEGVAVIWAFAARMCATCLLKNTIKVR